MEGDEGSDKRRTEEEKKKKEKEKEKEDVGVTLEQRKRRCYDLVSRLTEIEFEVEEQEERLRAAKRRRLDVEQDLAREKQAFLDQAASASTSSTSTLDSSTAALLTGEEEEEEGEGRRTREGGGPTERAVSSSSFLYAGDPARRAELEWEEWVLDAKTSHLSRFAARTRSPLARPPLAPWGAAEEGAAPSQGSAPGAAGGTPDLPVPAIQERPATVEPPRLRSRVRARRSLSLTGPSTPVRKRLQWEADLGKLKEDRRRAIVMGGRPSGEERADADPRYSLWLMPERESAPYTLLMATISALADRVNERMADGGASGRRAPLFLPHLTLLGSISGMDVSEVESRVRTLAERIGRSSLRVQMEGLGVGNLFHQCVFVTAKKTDELMNAHAIARDVMGMDQPTSYMPHVSLLYAELEEQPKDDFIQQLKAEGKVVADKVSFEAKAIHVWRTDGPEEGWQEVACIPFSIQ